MRLQNSNILIWKKENNGVRKKDKTNAKTAVIAQGGITNIEDGKLIKKSFVIFGMAQSLIADGLIKNIK